LDVVVQKQRLTKSGNVADLIGLVFRLAFENHFLDSIVPNSGLGVSLGNEHSGGV